MNKLLLRKDILKKRESLTLEERDNYSKSIAKLLYSTLEYKEAKNIFIYMSFNSEVDTIQIIEQSFKLGKKIFIPYILKDKEIMHAIEIEAFNNLKRNCYGILEPVFDKSKINDDNIDLVIVPGIVFDKKGNRIGYGGGYYDRFLLKNKNLHIIGLSFEIQIVENILNKKHDIPMNKIITEKRIIETSKLKIK